MMSITPCCSVVILCTEFPQMSVCMYVVSVGEYKLSIISFNVRYLLQWLPSISPISTASTVTHSEPPRKRVQHLMESLHIFFLLLLVSCVLHSELIQRNHYINWKCISWARRKLECTSEGLGYWERPKQNREIKWRRTWNKDEESWKKTYVKIQLIGGQLVELSLIWWWDEVTRVQYGCWPNCKTAAWNVVVIVFH